MSSMERSQAAGWAALKAANWPGAKAAFEAALSEQAGPEAHEGLSRALWWLNEITAAHDHCAAAYTQYKERGQIRRAARLAAWLAREQVFLHANVHAINGWFARAERLLDAADPGPEQGWVQLFRASMVEPPPALERIAFETLDLARHYGDTDLEILALAFGGLAQVTSGRVDAGLTRLDEAMAAVVGGEAGDFMVISEVFCVLLSACELAGDLERTEHWCRTAADYAERHHCSFLSAYCRTTYGGLLTATGRWGEAESELTDAIRAFESGHRALRVHAVLRLADLRVQQARLEEAEVLLRGFEDQGEAVAPLARLHLAKGEAPLARAVLEQALPPSEPRALSHAPLLLLLVEALLALGETEAARTRAAELTVLAQQTHSELLAAQAVLAQGHIALIGDEAQAQAHFQSALAHLRSYGSSLLAGRARLELARTLKDRDRPAAITWARAALAIFGRLGAAQAADQAAKVLRALGVSGRRGSLQPAPLTPREAEVLALLARGLTNKAIARRLVISAKTVEHHVGQILGKLGLRSRAEAAAYAQREAASRE